MKRGGWVLRLGGGARRPSVANVGRARVKWKAPAGDLLANRVKQRGLQVVGGWMRGEVSAVGGRSALQRSAGGIVAGKGLPNPAVDLGEGVRGGVK